MMKSVLVASAVLVAFCSAADARHVVHHRSMASAAAVRMPQPHPYPAFMAYDAMMDDWGYDAHRYHGGPKVND